MYEVELKVRADHDPVRRRLRDLGADSRGLVRQVDTYYDAPHRDFAETDEALRLRRETGEDGEEETRLTYKGPLVETASKTRQEAETGVGDAEALERALTALDFTPAAVVEKDRHRFAFRGYTVSLDDVDGLGEFVEVEAEAEEGEVETVREGASATLEALGLDPADGIRRSYLGMLLAGDR